MVSRGALEGPRRPGGLPTFFPHYLTASGGCRDRIWRTRVPARLSPPAARGIPRVVPGRRHPAAVGLLQPPGPRTRGGPLLSAVPTQAHGSMKLREEEAERQRSRQPRPRLGQEERYRKKGWNWKEENSFQRQNSSPPPL